MHLLQIEVDAVLMAEPAKVSLTVDPHYRAFCGLCLLRVLVQGCPAAHTFVDMRAITATTAVLIATTAVLIATAAVLSAIPAVLKNFVSINNRNFVFNMNNLKRVRQIIILIIRHTL